MAWTGHGDKGNGSKEAVERPLYDTERLTKSKSGTFVDPKRYTTPDQISSKSNVSSITRCRVIWRRGEVNSTRGGRAQDTAGV